MKIIHANPPMYDEIDAVFHVRGNKNVIFTWGDTIYVPGGGDVSPELRAHEGVHFSRQTNDPAKIRAWWERYLIDPEFRFDEELPAHRAEYRTFKALNKDRNAHIRALYHIAARLSGPLYGGLVSDAKARSLLLK